MVNKQELEKNLIERVAKKIGKDNQTLEEVIEKMMKSVDNWAKEHKKDLAGLDEKTRQEFRKPSFLLSKLIKIKYAEGKLTNIVYKNLKRAPGNLSEEQRMLAIYDTFKKFDYKCPYSGTLLLGSKEEIHLEHIIPVAMGGPTDDWNCIPICGTCNSSKKDKHLLDWWKDNRQGEEEYKLVKIFEHMTSKLLDETNTIKYVKQENNPMHLDAITFLNQLLNHIEENKQYIFNKEFDSEKEKQNAINSKLKELKSIFEKVVKKNDRNTKTDKQYFNEQKEMVKYVKSLGVSSYYKIAYTYFNTIKEMQNLGKPEEEIKAFCITQDDVISVDLFIEDLLKFINDNGKYPSTNSEDSAEKTLGNRVASYRKRYKLTQLSPEERNKTKLRELSTEEIEKLNSIGFRWDESRKIDIDEFIEDLKKFLIENNGRYPNSESKDAKEKTLGNRVDIYRKRYKVSQLSFEERNKTKLRELSTEEIEKLNSIGFIWYAKKKLDVDEFIRDLEKFIKDNGRYPSAKSEDSEEKTLGNRVSSYRKKHNAEELDPLEEEKLNAFGFLWEDEKGKWFDGLFEQIVKYKQDHNGFDGITSDPIIGSQVGNMRSAKAGYGSIYLSDDMVTQLDKIGFPWKVEIEIDIDQFIADLTQHLENYNGEYPTESTNPLLCHRVQSVRKKYANNKLEDPDIKKLNKIKFLWKDIVKINYDEFINNLLLHLKDNNGRYPSLDSESALERELARSVDIIRNRKERNRIGKEDLENLNNINFVWTQNVKITDKFINDLKQFVIDNGRYPSDDSHDKKERVLAQNVYKIRSNKNGIDDVDLIKLNEINFLWEREDLVDVDELIDEILAFKERFKIYPRSHPKDPKQPNESLLYGRMSRILRQNEVKLTTEQRQRLDNNDFVWDATLRIDIDKFIQNLEKFINDNGRYPSSKCKDNEFEKTLGGQVGTLRQNRKNEILEPVEIAKLDAIGFVWDAKKIIDIDQFIEDLLKFISDNDRYPSAKCKNDPIEKTLGNRVSTYRKRHRLTQLSQEERSKSKLKELSQEEMDKLNLIGFIWSQKTQKVQENNLSL